MNRCITFSFWLAASVIVAQAQTAAKPSSPTHTPTSAHTATHASAGVKLPPGIPPVSGPVETAFSLRYQDIKIGTGPLAEPRKV